MTIIEFMHAHPFIAWCSLWLLWGVAAIVMSIMRTIRLAICGWPPSHLDADGDFREEEEEQCQEE